MSSTAIHFKTQEQMVDNKTNKQCNIEFETKYITTSVGETISFNQNIRDQIFYVIN